MVYVYATQNELNNHIGKNLEVEKIEEILKELGMDVKGVSDETDPELKIEITAEKMEFISSIGIARAIKYYLGEQKEVPKYSISKSGLKVQVEKSVELARPKTVGAILRDVPITEELLEEMIKIQEKIHDSFGRNRKKAAIGIYPMDDFEFPLKYRAEEPSNISFRPLMSDEIMTSQDILEQHETGKKFAHLVKDFDLYPVYRDNKNNVLSFPPIINSFDTGRVTTEHKDLFVEMTGYNIQHLDNILKVLITTFIEMGAKAQSLEFNYESTGETYELNLDNSQDEIELDYINKLIGLNLSEEEAKEYLNKAMYGVNNIENGKIQVEIPVFRTDVWNDCDIADDVARAFGYNNIQLRTPKISTVGEKLDSSRFKDQISETLTQMGFLETYTYMLTSTKDQFKLMNREQENENFVKLSGCVDEGLNMIRTMILPESLKTLNINRKNKYPQKIFENGWTIQEDNSKDTKTINQTHLTVSIADPKANYTQIKAILDSILKLNEIEFEIQETTKPFLIEGRSAKILVQGEEIGFIGEIAPQILKNFGLLVPVSSFEINLEKIFEISNK